MEITTSEFFCNIKKLPPPGSQEFIDLIKWEEEKIKGGVTINGVFITPWLYWHLNHWKIRIDHTDQWGNEVREESLPLLRDNEWIRAEYLEKCRVEKKGYMEIGGRQAGKSEMEASYFGMNSIMFKLTQNVIVCGNDNDLSLLKDKVDFGLKNVWEGINIPRLDKTWRSNQIRLGYKKPNGDDEVWSYIVIRNAKDGHNTEVSAGTTAKTFIMDEVGKYPFSQAYEAGVPAMKGANGFRAVPILVGTGGSFDNGKDAENFFLNPEANNFLAVQDEKTNKKTCVFLSGLYRQDCKIESNLADYLISKGVELKDTTELKKIKIKVSDKELAQKTIEQEREAAKKNPDRTIYLKKVMYYPLTIEECFLSNSDNIFDIDAAKRQQQRLYTQERTGTPVVLFINDEGKINHEFTDKLPITNFPLRPSDSKDAPVIIYEFPVDNAPYGLYTAGCLLPGEKVLTSNGLKNVEKVCLEDKLINIEGIPVEIINLQSYLKENEDVFKIKVSNSYRTTTFTQEHPLLVSEAGYTYFDGKNKLIDESKFNFKFEDVKNIKQGMWVKVPNRYIQESNNNINRYWPSKIRRDFYLESPLENTDFWWIVGLWLGDGWTVNSKNKNKVEISFNINEVLHINRFKQIISTIWNIPIGEKIKGNCVTLSVNSKQLSEFFNNNFGKYTLNKYISEWVKFIPKKYKEELLLGYLDSDGCVTLHKKTKGIGIEWVSISLTLLEDVQDILFSLGYVSNLNKLRGEKLHTFKGREIPSTTKKTYTLRIGNEGTIKFRNSFSNVNDHKLINVPIENTHKKQGRKGCFISQDQKNIYFQITDIEKRKYSGWVFNFECDTHTYMCKNIPTHNCDPYRQGKSEYSSSLGSVHIYKRMHDITGEKYQDMFVASYCARPDKKEKWEEQARLLIKFYNARTLCENDEISFIDYMISKGDAHYLERQPEWLKEIVPNTTVSRDYGIHRSAEKIRNFLHSCLKKYLEEEILTERDKDGNIVKQYLGVHRILDPLLLEEIIQYNDEEGNFDRLISAELAIALAMKMDPIHGKVTMEKDGRFQSLGKTKKYEGKLFNDSVKGLFTKRKRSKLFV